MSDILLSILLGVVEGLTEFLPVSSTAHLRIVQAMVRGEATLQDPFWTMYAIVIQLGAILAVVVYFWPRLLKFLSTFPRGQRGDRGLLSHPLTLIVVAFASTVLPVLVFKKLLDANLRSLYAIGCALLVGGVIMWVVDAMAQRGRTEDVERMSLPQAIWIGLAQSLAAIFPGTSRSMATIAAGQTAGLTRATALEFSFFLCIPTMFAATFKDLRDFMKEQTTAVSAGVVGASGGPVPMDAHHWLVLAIGFVVSFFVAWAVVAWFLHWVRKHGFVVFAVYRIIFGLGILLWIRYANT